MKNTDTNAILEKFINGKAKYNIWSECTEKRFKVWNESDFTIQWMRWQIHSWKYTQSV